MIVFSCQYPTFTHVTDNVSFRQWCDIQQLFPNSTSKQSELGNVFSSDNSILGMFKWRDWSYCCVNCIFIGRYQEMQRTRFTDDLWHVHVKKNSTLTLIRNEFNSKGGNCDRGLLSVSDFCTSPHGTPLGFPCHRRCQPNLYQIEILIAHPWHSLISEMMVKMTLILDQFFVFVRLGWTDTCFLRDSK